MNFTDPPSFLANFAGVPPAVSLKASGHASEEWKRYLNMTPSQLQNLFKPLGGQHAEAVKVYGLDGLRQLREAFGYDEIANLLASLQAQDEVTDSLHQNNWRTNHYVKECRGCVDWWSGAIRLPAERLDERALNHHTGERQDVRDEIGISACQQFQGRAAFKYAMMHDSSSACETGVESL